MRRRWTRFGTLTVVAGLVAAVLTVSGLNRNDIVAMPQGAAGPALVKATEQEAVATAKATGKRVEVAQGRGERTTVYANPTGTFTREEHQQPIRTMRNGKWVPVDANIVKYSNGRLGPKASTVAMSFSNGGATPFATVNRMGRTFSLSWPGTLPAPVLDGKRATYRNVLPDVDLVVNAEVTGFSHVLVVKTAQAAKNPELAAITLGLSTERTKLQVRDGHLVATDAGSGGTMFVAPAPIMWDSGTGAAPGEDLEPTRLAPENSRTARMGVKVTGDKLVITPNAAMLADPTLNFPLYIDPAFRTESHAHRAMVDSGYADQEYYDWSADQRVGLCPSDVNNGNNCNSSQRKRIFFEMPTSFFMDDNMQILSANFFVTLKHVENCCSRTYETELWRVDNGIGSWTNFGNQPSGDNWAADNNAGDPGNQAFKVNGTTSLGTQACGNITRNLVMGVTSAIQYANTWNHATTTFGMKASNEGDYRNNRRFCNDAYISVEYNLKPNGLLNLNSDPGGGCATGSSRPYVPKQPIIKATPSDVDSTTERLSVEFMVTWPGLAQPLTSELPSSSSQAPREFNLAAAVTGVTIPDNVVVSWMARTSDWTNDGATRLSTTDWTSPCEFEMDTTQPEPPVVTSPQYLPSGCAVYYQGDGVGEYGSFVMDSPSADVTQYKYEFTGASGASGQITVVTTGGAASTIQWMPTKEGPHTLTVWSVDGAGAQSKAPASCNFYAKPGLGPVAEFPMKDAVGAASAVNTVEAGNAAARGTGATFGAEGPDGVLGGAVQLDGTSNGYLTAPSLGKVDTAQAFTVSAWVKLADINNGAAILSQDATGEPGFVLGFSGGTEKKYYFYMPQWDAEGYNIAEWRVKGDTGIANKWTHLVAGFDPVKHEIWIQVDKGTVYTASHRSQWASHGNIQIGRRNAKTGYVWPLNGTVSDVKLFNRWASADDAGYTRRIGRTGYWPLDEITNNATSGYAADGTTVESVKALTVNGAALQYPPAACDPFETDECPPSVPTELMGNRNKYFDFDGTDNLNSAAHLVGLKGSFTIAARVRLAAACDAGEQVVMSQPGANRSRFRLSCLNNRWRAFFGDADNTGTGGIYAESEPGSALPESDAATGQHIAVTYDLDHSTIKIYVNGQLYATDGTKTSVPLWPGTTDGGLEVGRQRISSSAFGNYFSGDMDELRVYAGVLTQQEIQQIASTTVDVTK